jgi:hypothetical protein
MDEAEQMHESQSLPGNIADLTEIQTRILMHLAFNGPIDTYGAHKTLGQKLSTTQKAMKLLETKGLIAFLRSVPTEKNRTKNVYHLAFPGFLVVLDTILISGNGYHEDDLHRVVALHAALAPSVFGRWDWLTRDREGVTIEPVEQSVFIPFTRRPEQYWVPTLWSAVLDTWTAFLNHSCPDELLDGYFADSFPRKIAERMQEVIETAGRGLLPYPLSVIREDGKIWHAVRKEAVELRKSYSQLAETYGWFINHYF